MKVDTAIEELKKQLGILEGQLEELIRENGGLQRGLNNILKETMSSGVRQIRVVQQMV